MVGERGDSLLLEVGMLSRGLLSLLVALLPSVSAAGAAGSKPADVKVTQKSLLPLCLDGAPVAAGAGSWKLDAQEHTLAFTMKNDPRPGAPAGEQPGVARVRFTPEPGHKYEVEVRAPTLSFSQRSWNKGEWRPVVRDRTVDRIVSSEPEWTQAECR
jgi:hypothetical protein